MAVIINQIMETIYNPEIKKRKVAKLENVISSVFKSLFFKFPPLYDTILIYVDLSI